jgi:hypothetical protein
VTPLLLLAALAGGTLFTLLFDDEAPLSARLAAGVPIGLASLGLVGFVAASVLGMGTAALAVAALGVLWPLPLVAARADRRQRLASLLRPHAVSVPLLAGFVLLAALLWRVYDRAMFVTPAGAIATGDDHNIGDLPFHIGIITGFAEGGNYPPQHPELAGTRLTYPFLVNMVSALLVAAGARMQAALFGPNFLLATALVVLLYHWARLLTRDRLAGALTPVLVLFSGGLGWTLLAPDLASAERPWEVLSRLSRDYTIAGEGGLRWGNAITTLLIPQRSLLLGLPLFVTIATWWWRACADEPDDRRRTRMMIGAGVAAGLLPLGHAHSFVLAVAMGGLLGLLFPKWRAWAAFFVPALLLALPQIVWSAQGSALKTGAFLGWHVGWDRGEVHLVWFWLYNTGLFIPLLLLALVLHRRLLPPSLLRFYLPFTLCFVVPNLLRLSPWIWDNIKFLFYWYVASAPLVALVLARMARGPLLARVTAPILLLALVLAGALDVARVASGRIAHVLFDADAIAFAREVAQATPAHAVIADRPAYDSPVLLTGRPGLLGYTGHIWSQGLDAGDRERDLDQFYTDVLGPAALRERYGVEYAVLGPRKNGLNGSVSKSWQELPVVVRRGPYVLVRLGAHQGLVEQD